MHHAAAPRAFFNPQSAIPNPQSRDLSIPARRLSLTSARVPETIPKPDRLLSLDVMRGLVVVGMIVVNSASFVKEADDFDVYPLLLHAKWAGFTLADFVFPSFVFMVGVSIAIALRDKAPTRPIASSATNPTARPTIRPTLRAIAARTLRLFIAGLIISNLYWAANWGENAFRIMGVLQRIGLCYGACAILFLTVSARVRFILLGALLLLYWPLTLLPMPDAATDLHAAGANFVSWCDRAMFGPYIYVPEPPGFDPEGLVGTLPAIAQCLLGVAVGEWLLRHARQQNAARQLALAGAALALAGLGWSFVFPMIKAIWSSSFVLWTTGLAMILLGLCHWLFDCKQWRGVVTAFFVPFGMNAIFAYILHEFASLMLQGDLMRWFHDAASHALPPRAASLVPVIVFVLIIWSPLRYLQRRGWIIRI
jgi:predicted acyltransferase